MTSNELVQKVRDLIDLHCMELSKEEYADAMEEIAGDCSARAESARMELEDEID